MKITRLNRIVFLCIIIIALFSTSAYAQSVELVVDELEVEGRLTIISGTIRHADTLEPVGEGIPITVYCEHDSIVNIISFLDLATNDQGTYSSWTFNMFEGSHCEEGDYAWAEAHYDGKVYVSDRVRVSRVNQLYDYADADVVVGVPEFSTVSFGAAVLITGLGLAFLRRTG